MNIREITVAVSAKLAAVVALTTLLGTQAQAAIITLAATDSGWYTNTGQHSTVNQNYLAGSLTTGKEEYRNFFVFDLSGVTETIVGATFRAYNPSAAVPGDLDDGYISPDANETYAMFEVSTDIASLTDGSGGVAAFNDLAMGLSYGSREFGAIDNGSIVSIALNAADW